MIFYNTYYKQGVIQIIYLLKIKAIINAGYTRTNELIIVLFDLNNIFLLFKYF